MQRSRMFYHCYDHKIPTGGQKSTYQHVDALNRRGFSAAVIHGSHDNRLSWFANDTKILTWSELWSTFDPICDYLVLHEDLGSSISEYPGRKVIFNKGLWNGFSEIARTGDDPYTLPEVLAVLSVSEHNRQNLQFTYPQLPLIHVTEHLDSEIFRYVPIRQKRKQIALSPKATARTHCIQHMFGARAKAGLNRGLEYRWISLEHKTEQEIAKDLGEAMMFLFCSSEEGLGRVALEAMLCGCLPLAYRVGPLREYLPPFLPSDIGDPLEIVRIMERVVNSQEPGALFETELLACRQTALQFSAEKQSDSVCNAWEEILKIR